MKKILISLFILIVVFIGAYFYLSNVETTPISHHWEGYKNWYKSSGSEAITGDQTKFLGGKHRGEEGYRVSYINSIGESVNKGTAPYIYPEGTVIVKEQWKTQSAYESNAKPELNIMIKLAADTSPKTGDWGYVTLFRRKIHSGTSKNAKFCGGCHKGANLKKGDFVFVNKTTHPK